MSSQAGTTGAETSRPRRIRAPGVFRVKAWTLAAPSGWATQPSPKCQTKREHSNQTDDTQFVWGRGRNKGSNDPKSICGVLTQALGLKRGRVGCGRGHRQSRSGCGLVCLQLLSCKVNGSLDCFRGPADFRSGEHPLQGPASPPTHPPPSRRVSEWSVLKLLYFLETKVTAGWG